MSSLHEMLAECIKAKFRIDIENRPLLTGSTNHLMMHRVYHKWLNRSESVCISIINDTTNPLLGRIIVFESSHRHDPHTEIFNPADPHFTIDDVITYAKQMAKDIKDRQTS